MGPARVRGVLQGARRWHGRLGSEIREDATSDEIDGEGVRAATLPALAGDDALKERDAVLVDGRAGTGAAAMLGAVEGAGEQRAKGKAGRRIGCRVKRAGVSGGQQGQEQ
jgi:hypothetical protein